MCLFHSDGNRVHKCLTVSKFYRCDVGSPRGTAQFARPSIDCKQTPQSYNGRCPVRTTFEQFMPQVIRSAFEFLPRLENMPRGGKAPAPAKGGKTPASARGQTVVCNRSGTCVKGAYKPVGDKSAHQRLAAAAGMKSPVVGASIKPGGAVGLRSESING